jgi:uncharacterized membrane protein YqjE
MADRSAVLNHTDFEEVGQRSTGQIIQDVARDLRDMVRSELRLAKAEMKETVAQAGKAAGMFGGAAVCGLFAVACFVTTCVWALSLAMPWGVAALLMAILLVCIGGALYAGGRSKMKQVNPVPERTVETLKEPLR